jgi:2-dehydro-3-deoxygalactonokinase
MTMPLYCIDMGTTNCRVYVTEGTRVWSRVEDSFGVRDSVRQSPNHLRERLEALMAEGLKKAKEAGLTSEPQFAVGAGMLTSAQGLLEIAHLQTPVSEMDLARHMEALIPTLAGGIHVVLVPGVRTGPLSRDLESALRADIMRGEETLVAGLVASGRMQPNGAMLNLGSHWKWIWVDSERRISRSRTTMTGELIHVTQAQTLLASSLPKHRPNELHREWLDRGGREARESGLSRALFCVRLLDQAGQGTPEERLSFLYGAYIEVEMAALEQSQSLRGVESICITGPAAVAHAWEEKLQAIGSKVEVVDEADRDQAYLEGLHRIFSLAKEAGSVTPQ